MIGRKGVLAGVLTVLLSGALRAESPFAQAALAQEPPSEADVKAAILLHFARYTEWPESVFAASPTEFRIGVLGPEGSLAPIEKALKDKKIGGRTPKLVRGTLPKDLSGCALVYILESEKDQTQDLLTEFKGKPVLTVGETDGFGESGGILGFYKEDNRIKFGMNPAAMARAGLKATQLLPYAKKLWRDK